MNYVKIAPSLIKDIFVNEKIIASIACSLINEENISEENVKDSICQHLLHRGYLTLDSENIYKIPNKEIRESLKTLLLKLTKRWIESNWHSVNSFCSLIYKLAMNIENFDKYLESIKEDLLPRIPAGKKSERDFQELIASPLWMSLIGNKDSKYTVHSEYTVKNCGRLDHLFMPIPEKKCSTAIIHEYKQVNDKLKIYSHIINAV